MINPWICPLEADYLDWSNFQIGSIALLGLIILLFYFLYRLWLYKFKKLKVWSDVFKLRNSWITTLWLMLVIQILGSIIIGLAIISEITFSIIISIIFLAFVEGVIGMVIYWLICYLFPLPNRVKYIPFLKIRRRQ